MEQVRGERFVYGLQWGIWYDLTNQEQFTSFSGRKRQLAGNVARKADFDEIPTISLRAPEEQIIEQLRDACTRVGFFYIKVC